MSGVWKGVVGFLVARPLIAIVIAAAVVGVTVLVTTRGRFAWRASFLMATVLDDGRVQRAWAVPDEAGAGAAS
jgi:uncharacterized membrane protein YdfJ with MMPL/SSD domain